jgi:hypothetical protein
MTIEDALAALGRSLTEAGVPLWQRPGSTAELDALTAELAPLRLPGPLREFWQQVDVRTLRVTPWPGFCTPEFALESWQKASAQFASIQPLALVGIGYESHQFLSVELDSEDVDGGAVFQWWVDDASGFERRFNGLTEWLEHLAGLISRGFYYRVDFEGAPNLHVPGPDVPDPWALAPFPAMHPVYGDVRHVGADILEWPAHWQRANGVRMDMLELRGATHTVADVLAWPPGEALRATIAARVVGLAGSGAWMHARVDDGTGQLDVSCSPRTTLLGPRHSDWFEFDIVGGPGVVPPPTEPETAAVAAAFSMRHGDRALVTAEAIRRMPAPSP